MKEKINKDMTFSEAMEKHPKIGEILFSKGLACVMCHCAPSETIEQGCKAHGMTDKQINDLVKELNEKIK